MFVSSAYAQAAASAPSMGTMDVLQQFLPLVLIFVVFYLLLIRPQQKRMKQHKQMLADLRRGDRVVTSGGIIGTVNKVVSDTELVIEIAEGVRVRVVRATVAEVLGKGEAAAASADKAESDK